MLRRRRDGDNRGVGGWYPRHLRMTGPARRELGQLCGWLWVSFLAVVLLLATVSAHRLATRTQELAYGCDSFGYLQMAREIRRAAANAAPPDFHFESKQTRLLIDHMKSQHVRLGRWAELVAPHAHHYFPRADRVGVQYPPGTALALAIFPEQAAVHRLIRTAAWALLATGWAALLLAGIRQAWASAGLVVLSLYLGLEMLVRLSPMSFCWLLSCSAACSRSSPRLSAAEARAWPGSRRSRPARSFARDGRAAASLMAPRLPGPTGSFRWRWSSRPVSSSLSP